MASGKDVDCWKAHISKMAMFKVKEDIVTTCGGHNL